MTADLASLVEGRAPVLVLAPHADDESLACGLMLAARWGRGLPAHVACLTDGAASHPGSRRWPAPRLAALRRTELEAAVARLGGVPARDVTWLGHPDAGLHRVHGPGADLARDVARLVDRLGARVLVAASGADPHCDHEACAEAARRVAARRPGLALWDYAVWSRWQAWGAGGEAPGLHLDLPEWRAAKTQAVAAHRSQMGLVIDDDPGGFSMPLGFAARLCAAPEVYLPVPA